MQVRWLRDSYNLHILNDMDGVGAILDAVRQHANTTREAVEFYHDKFMPLGFLARRLGKSVASLAASSLYAGPLLKMHIDTSEQNVHQSEVRRIDVRKPLIVDLPSFMLMHGSDAFAAIRAFPVRMICQSWLDEIHGEVNRLSLSKNDGHMIMSEENGQIYRQDISPEDIRKNIEFWQVLLESIKRECTVIGRSPNRQTMTGDTIGVARMLGDGYAETLIEGNERDALVLNGEAIMRALSPQRSVGLLAGC
jgi:hypothetical protein